MPELSLTPTEWVAIIGAIVGGFVAILKASSEAAKTRAETERTRAEVAAMRAELEASRALDEEHRASNDQLLRETHHQVTPNNGGSIIDATRRLEVAVERVQAAQEATASDLRGIRRDVGRLADADAAMTERKDREHDKLNRRIDALAHRLGIADYYQPPNPEKGTPTP